MRDGLIAPAEPGRRNRRTIDALLLGVAGAAAAWVAVIAASAPDGDGQVGEALASILGWAGSFWRALFVGALALALLILAEVLWRRRWALARDLAAGLLVVAGVTCVLGRLVESDWLVVEADLWSRWGFPELRVAGLTAVVSIAAPELVRPARLLGVWLVALGSLGAVVLGAAHPSGVLGALAVGLGAGALVHVIFGTAAGVPPAAVVREALAALGVDVGDIAAAARQRIGAADYVAHDREGRPLAVRVLGRDAQDTQRLARRVRALAYRDPPRSGAVGRLEQVEHEALATMLATRAGVRAPEVVAVGLGPEGDAVLVLSHPDGQPIETAPASRLSETALRELWDQLARLRGAGISHGRLNAGNVILVGDAPMVRDFSAATLGAPQSALDIDVAGLLVACAVLVGEEPTLRAAIAGVGAPAVAAALPYLQPAALTPHLRDLARSRKLKLGEFRAAAAAAVGAPVPDVVPLRRFRARNLVVTAFIALAAYLLVSQLAEVGLDTIVDELRDADVAWVILALVLAQLPLLAQAVSLRGAVPTPLPLLPCVLLQSALKVVNLTVPGSAGRIAVNVRFLQRTGASTGEAVAAGAVDGVSETIVQVALILMVLPFVDLDLHGADLSGGLPAGRLIATVLIALALIVAVVIAVPPLRAKVIPAIRPGIASLGVVMRTRRKRLELFGGNVASEVLFALALGAACQAYGVDLALAELLLVNMAASTLSGLVPVPGGVGAQEAAVTAGLVAVGVDESTAFAIALTHRMCTYFLPPIWGYFSLRWLRRAGYV